MQSGGVKQSEEHAEGRYAAPRFSVSGALAAPYLLLSAS